MTFRSGMSCLAAALLGAAVTTVAAPAAPAQAANRVALGPDGRAHFAIPEPTRIQVRRERPDGTLEDAKIAYRAPEGARILISSVSIEVDGQGRATIVWSESGPGNTSAIRGRRRAPNGAFFGVRTLVEGNDFWSGSMDIDRHGNAIVAWTAPVDGRRTVLARRWSSTAELSDVQTIDTSYAGANPPPIVDVNAAGAAVIAWPRSSPYGFAARMRAADGTLRPIRVVSPEFALGAKIADDGRALLAYQGGVRPMAADGTLGAPLALSASRVLNAKVGFSPGGTAAIAYYSDDGDTEGQGTLAIRHLAASGELGPAKELADTIDSAPASVEDVVLDQAGNATVAWYENVNPGNHHELRTRRLRADGTLSATRAFASGIAYWIDLAAAADGTVAYFWRTTTDKLYVYDHRTRRQLPDETFGPAASVGLGD